MSRREQIEAMLQDAPDDAELNYFLAMEYLSEGEEEQAETRLRQLIENQSDYVPLYLQLGQIYQRQGEEEQAIETYKKGIALAKQQGNEHAANEMTGFLAMLE